jgi:integrase
MASMKKTANPKASSTSPASKKLGGRSSRSGAASRRKRFTKTRRQQGCGDGTIRSDLAYISAALGFAQRNGFIGRAPAIAKPPAPRARERWLTREELKRLIAGAGSEHVRLFIILAICTAGRPKHILELPWSRVDMDRCTINLDDPEQGRTRKGRARVPINSTAQEALKRARLVAQTDYVIEHNGKPLKSIKRGVLAAANRANLKGVSQYVLRHTAGVYLAQAGVPLAEIAEYMGHSNLDTTRRHYARFHPDHLRQASKSLEI